MITWDDLQDIEKGGACLVIGNGPGLNDIPDAFLRAYPSFGANRIYLRKDFQPTFYTVINANLIEQYLPEIITLPQKVKFVRAQYADQVPSSIPIVSLKPHQFSYTPGKGLYEGWTVTFVNLQIAYWMGFEQVILVGVDHDYDYDATKGKNSYLAGEDPNHFDPNYFKGAFWDHPSLKYSEEAYILAKEAYEKDGREILNASTRTKLDVFKKVYWHELS
jgi:hypothetical protein